MRRFVPFRRVGCWPTVGLSLLLVVMAFSCSKKEQGGSAESAQQATGAGFQGPLLQGLQKAGLDVGEFEATAARPYQAKACVRGEIGKLDVLSCQYESEADAKRAEAAVVQFVGSARTGAVRQSGRLSLAVADRGKTDPRGKQVDQLLKAFSGLELK